jgi:hypothetical protein
MKAIQWPYPEIIPKTDIPANQPITVIPAWNPPKKMAILPAARMSRTFVVVPIARDTAKQSIESPIPMRRGVRRSIYRYMVGWAKRKAHLRAPGF